MTTWIIIGIIAVLIIAAIAVYNNLVRCRKEVDNSWAQIDVQLKRRCDLIPNLVETVKGYAAHESGVLDNVTRARSAAMSPNLSTANRIEAESKLTGALQGLMVQVEAYPELKANQNFLALQEELASTENRISFARQHYNDTATNYNTAIAVFPACIFASIFNFKDAELWQITDAADREVPKVKF
jgi:LemA protein